MRNVLKIAIALACCLPTSVEAEPADKVSYHKLGFLQNGILGSGYRDKSRGPKAWKVTGKTGGRSYSGPANIWIAIYRSAELSESVGARYFRVLKWNGQSINPQFGANSLMYSGQEFIIEIEATDTPDEKYHCATEVLRSDCRTIDVAAAKAEIRPFLIFPDSN